MMVSHYAMITLYRYSIRSFLIKKININFHFFNHLSLVSSLNFPKSDVGSFLLCNAFWDIQLQNTSFWSVSWEYLGTGRLWGCHSDIWVISIWCHWNVEDTVPIPLLPLSLWILFSSGSPLSLKVNWHDFSIYSYCIFVKSIESNKI